MSSSETIEQISVLVNGQEVHLSMPATIATLVEIRKPRPPFAVELNKQLVKRTTYADATLHDQDRVEIVTLVGGG